MKLGAGAFWLRTGVAFSLYSICVLTMLNKYDRSLVVLARPGLMLAGGYILWLGVDTGWRNAFASQAAGWSARCLILLQVAVALFALVRFVVTKDWTLD